MAFPWEPLGEEAEVAEGAAASGIWPPSCAEEKAELGGGVRSRRLELGEELAPAQVHHLSIGHTGQPGPCRGHRSASVGSPAPERSTPCPACPLGGTSVRHEIKTQVL